MNMLQLTIKSKNVLTATIFLMILTGHFSNHLRIVLVAGCSMKFILNIDTSTYSKTHYIHSAH